MSCCKAWTTCPLHAAALLTRDAEKRERPMQHDSAETHSATNRTHSLLWSTLSSDVPSVAACSASLVCKDACGLSFPRLAACQIYVKLRQQSSITHRSYSLVYVLLDDALSFFSGDHVVSSSAEPVASYQSTAVSWGAEGFENLGLQLWLTLNCCSPF